MWGDYLLSLCEIVIATNDFLNHKNLIEHFKKNNAKIHLCNTESMDIEIAVLKYNPDILILENTEMASENLERLIKNIMLMKNPPAIFAVLPYEDPYMIHTLRSIGVVKFIHYPYDPSELMITIDDYIKDLPIDISHIHSEINKSINNMLMLLDFHSGMHGFGFLRKAIFIYVTNRDGKINFSKKVYPEIADRNDTTPQCVEWTIRSAISKAWPKANSNIKDMFFDDAKFKSNKPTNSEFIITIGDYIKNEFSDVIEKTSKQTLKL